MLKPMCAGFLGGIYSVFSGAFDVFWRALLLAVATDSFRWLFKKTSQNAPFEKTSLNQQRRKEVVAVVVVATRPQHQLQQSTPTKLTFNAEKQPNSNDNANTVKNATPTF
jgi:hypothetical protein